MAVTDCTKIEFDDLREALASRKNGEIPIMIAIDGPSGAGKSYFAKKLSSILLDSFVVEMDYFISWNSLDNGVDRAINQLFEPLTKLSKARFQARDWVGDFWGDRLGDWKDVPKSDYYIFEGISSSRIEYSKYLDVVIWIEAPEEVCIKRGLERDGDNLIVHWKRFKLLEQNFFDKDNSKFRADYIVDSYKDKIYKNYHH
jgi:uridine kinase